MKLRLPTFVHMFWAAIKGWSSDDVPRLGASLAYYTLFAISPILIIVIAIAGTVYGPDAVRGQIVGEIGGLIGQQGAAAIQTLLQSAHRDSTGSLAVVIGTATLLIAASGAFLELQHALNTIFRVKTDPKKSGIERLLLSRLRSFGLVVSIGFLLLVSLIVSAALTAVATRFEHTAVGSPAVLQVLNVVITLAVMTLLFGLIYRLLPDVRLAWRDVWIGAFVTSMLFSIGKFVIGLYLGHSSVASSYGAAGSIVVLLVWVYYSAQIILLGAEFTRVYAQKTNGRAPAPNELARRDPDAHPSAPTAGELDRG